MADELERASDAGCAGEAERPLPRRTAGPVLVRRLLIAAGLLLSAWMVSRSQFGGDQLNLLARGWLWASQGDLVPYGNPLSTGGKGPGPATTILVGGPLFLWMDARAPVVLVWLSHLAAFLLLDRALRPHLAEIERLAFVALYWFNPWRMTASASLWNPNLLFLFGAVHLTTAMASRRRASFFQSFAHVLALGIAFQLHPGTLLAAALSVLLWWRGFFRVHWWGTAAGVAATLVSLAPWLIAVGDDPAIATADTGFPFRGLLWVFPLLKGLYYLVRYGSLALGQETTVLDFTPALGADVDAWLAPLARVVLGAAAGVTAIASLAATVAFVRSHRHHLLPRREHCGPQTGRAWIERYALLALAAAAVVFGAAPTTPQYWQALAIFHAAILPPVLVVGRLSAEGRPGLARGAVTGFAGLALIANLAIGLGGPGFRCGGRSPVVFPLRAESPMFDELGLQRICPWPLGVPGAWWPDVLPEDG